MTTTNEAKQRVMKAAQRLEDAHKDARRISNLMNGQPTTFDAQRLSAVRDRVEDLSASVMLGEASREALEEARAEMAELEEAAAAAASEAREIAECRAGLERRLSEVEGAIENTKQDLIEATKDWLTAELIEADEAYVRAARKAAETFARVKAIGAVLDYRKACPTATKSHIDMQLPVIGPASLTATGGKLRGGIRGVIGPTVNQANFAKDELSMEFKSLGALWPVQSGR